MKDRSSFNISRFSKTRSVGQSGIQLYVTPGACQHGRAMLRSLSLCKIYSQRNEISLFNPSTQAPSNKEWKWKIKLSRFWTRWNAPQLLWVSFSPAAEQPVTAQSSIHFRISSFVESIALTLPINSELSDSVRWRSRLKFYEHCTCQRAMNAAFEEI